MAETTTPAPIPTPTPNPASSTAGGATAGGATAGSGVDGVAFGDVTTEFGRVLAAVTGAGLVATAFPDSPGSRTALADRLGLPVRTGPGPAEAVVEQLREYFAGERRTFAVDIDWRLMSRAQRTVLGLLHETVPYGTVVTYGDLARRTGIPARGIGAIMGSNPIPIVVPCHRVVAGTGLGGFSGGTGVESKRQLLTLEGYLSPGLW